MNGAQQLAHAILRRAEEVLAQLSGAGRVGVHGSEYEVELEAAGLDELDQRLEGRLDIVRLPSGDLRAVAADARPQLGLRQTSPQTRVADDHPARHRPSLASRGKSIMRD